MKTLFKANLSSLAASLCDYLATIIFKECLHLDAVLSSIIGTIIGGIINFLIGRHWVFKSRDMSVFRQGRRYLLAWVGNMVLNALGVASLIRFGRVNYLIAKVITSITIAIAYNYPIQKKYVYKNVDSNKKD